MALERVFAILLFYEGFVIKDNCVNFGCIHDFPQAWRPVEKAFLDELELWYPGAIIKTWQGR